MTLLSFARRLAARALALAAILGGSSAATAADETPAPAPAVAAPALGGPGCPTCNGGGPAAGHGSCGRLGCGTPLFGKKKAPYVVQLCPGACFGYFQTQWHKWEDVCPLPYQGVGQSDAPPPAPGYVAPVPQPRQLPDVKTPDTKAPQKPDGKGNGVPEPRQVKPNGTSALPTIPSVPLPPVPTRN